LHRRRVQIVHLVLACLAQAGQHFAGHPFAKALRLFLAGFHTAAYNPLSEMMFIS
jgi:hypothetical protein